MKLNILVLHNMADFSNTLRSMADYALCFERYAPQHNYFYQKITDPDTSALRKIGFHLVIIESSALGICRYRPRELWYEQKMRWSFVGESDAIKLAFPQDDYHQSDVLDELFNDWNVDVVYTVIPTHHDLLYPRMFRRQAVETVLTGYVDDNSIAEIESFATPYGSRPVDVGQRVAMYSPLGGRHAQLKGLFAEAMKSAASEAGLRVNISTRHEDRIFGDDWLRFLGRCRFVPGCESGVSIWDRKGEIFDKVTAYLAVRPSAPFEEVEEACFPGVDGKHVFSAISPRLFEAAMMRCSQVLIEAPYLGVLRPHEHYIPVKPDLSDIGDAVDLMRDEAAARRRADATYAVLIETPEYRYSALVQRVMKRVDEILALREVGGSSEPEFHRLKSAHKVELAQHRRETARSRRFASLPPGVAALVPNVAKRALKRLLQMKSAS